ncbi:MAG: hypothetical protein AB8B49_04350 [Nitratireductor sp.]
MSIFINQFFSNTPIWVWPLLVLLIAIGIRSSKTRYAPIALFYGLPFMGLLGLNGILRLEHVLLGIAAYALSMLLGALYGYRLQSALILGRAGNKVHLKGEWLTLVCLLLIFASNFVSGVLGATAPMIAASVWFCILFSLVVGFAGGSFVGRSFQILKTKALKS